MIVNSIKSDTNSFGLARDFEREKKHLDSLNHVMRKDPDFFAQTEYSKMLVSKLNENIYGIGEKIGENGASRDLLLKKARKANELLSIANSTIADLSAKLKKINVSENNAQKQYGTNNKMKTYINDSIEQINRIKEWHLPKQDED